jgi:hypothetical protein
MNNIPQYGMYQFSNLSTDRHLGSFQLESITNKAAMTIHVQNKP